MTEQRKLLGNSFSLLVNRLTQSITTFILIAFIARILGTYQLGQYMLAFSYYFVFMTLASQGFKTLFTRELAQRPEEASIYLVSGTLLQLISGIIGYIALVIVVFALPYSEDTSNVCYILGLTIIPFSLSNITEAIFQALEKMHLITISAVPIYILRVLIMIWAMSLKHDVAFLSIIFFISETIVLLVQWLLISRTVTYKLQVDWNFIWQTAKASKTFLFIEGISVFNSRMQVLILSLLGGEIVVGLYSAITQLMQPFEIVCNSLVQAFFPKMSKAVALGRQNQSQLIETIVEILLAVALPFTIGILFIGEDLLILLYKDPSFIQATIALKIIVFGSIISAFIRPFSYVLVANNFEIINLFDVFISTIIGGLASIFLVSSYKVDGAALSVIITQFVSLGIYIYGIRSRLSYLRVIPNIRHLILITILMLAVFFILDKYNSDILLTIFISTFTYILIIISLGVYTLGGWGVISAKLAANKKNTKINH